MVRAVHRAARPSPLAGPGLCGVPGGTVLTPSATTSVTTPGAVLEGLRLGAVTVEVDATGVTIRRCAAHSLVIRGDGATVEDCTVDGIAVSGADGVTVRRCDIGGIAGGDGVHINAGGDDTRAAGTLIESSWIRTPNTDAASHYDGIQVRGCVGLAVRWCRIDAVADDGVNAAVFLESANGGCEDVTIDGCVIDGGTNTVLITGSGVVLTRNRVGRSAPLGVLHGGSDVAGATEDSNVWDDTGEALSILDGD